MPWGVKGSWGHECVWKGAEGLHRRLRRYKEAWRGVDGGAEGCVGAGECEQV